MGELAGNLLDGFCCEQCGEVIDGKSPGYPRTCKPCAHGK